MKTLIIIRHAKSSWSDEGLSDHDRRLNERGRKDAVAMGAYLQNQQVRIDHVYCSTARRAVKTLKRISRHYAFNEFQIQFTDDLYLAELPQLLELIRSVRADLDHVAIIGHNPGLTELVNYLTGDNLGNLPTTGVYIVDLSIDAWEEVFQGVGQRRAFFNPKMFATPLA